MKPLSSYTKVPIATLTTERLVLRPIALTDAPRIQALIAHWDVVKFMGAVIPWPYPEDGAEEYLARAVPLNADCQDYVWAITERADPESEFIGSIGIYPNSDTNNRGFWLAEEFWGRGFMKEAVAAATEFAFAHLQMEQLILNNAALNTASHRIKESVGAELIEVADSDFVSGRFPSEKWRLTRDAWTAKRS